MFHPMSRVLGIGVLLTLAAVACAAENPQFKEISSVAVPYGKAYDAVVVGQRAYVANGAGGLVILDVSDAAKPKMVGRYITGNLGRDSIDREWIHEFRGRAVSVGVAPSGGAVKYAYVLTHSMGYDIACSKVIRIDIADASAPKFAGEYLLHGSANHVAAIDDNLVVVTRNTGKAGGESFPPNPDKAVSVIDFTEPGRVRIVGELTSAQAGPTPKRIAVAGRTAAFESEGKVYYADLRDLAAPKLTGVPEASAAPKFSEGLALVTPAMKAVLEGECKTIDIREHSLAVNDSELGPCFDISDPTVFKPAARAPGSFMGLSVASLSVLPNVAWVIADDQALLGELKLTRTERLRLRRVVTDGSHHAFFATGRDGLRIFDVSDPKNPVQLGRFFNTEINRHCIVDVKVVGTTAYLADLDNGLFIVDVTDPKSPTQLSHFHTGNAHAVDVPPGSNLAAVADGVYGLTVLDVSDPRNPKAVARYHAPDIKFNDVVIKPREGGKPLVYVADAGAVRCFELDLSATINDYFPPRLASVLKLPMGIPDMLRVSADGKHVYTASDEGLNFSIIDIDDPRKPTFVGNAATSGFCHGFAVQGNYAFACNNFDTCNIFDISDPRNPKPVSWVVAGPETHHAEVLGNALFVWTEQGTKCVDISDITKPMIKGSIEQLQPMFQVIERDGKRYVLGTGHGGWWVVDATDLAKPARLAMIEGGTWGATVAIDDLAYVTSGNTLKIIRWPDKPQVIATLDLGEPVNRVHVRGQYAVTTGRHLSLIDVADPSAPKLVSRVEAQPNEGTYGGGGAMFFNAELFTRDGHDYIAAMDYFWGVRLYDAADKSKLVEIGDYAVSGGDFTGIDAGSDDRIYVGNNWGGVYIVDAKDPLNPRLAGSTRRLTTPNKGAVGALPVGNTLYMQGNTDRTMRVVDVADPAAPKLLGELPIPREGQAGDSRRFGSTFPQFREGPPEIPELKGKKLLYTPGLARIYDVTDPARITLVGECKEAGFTNDSCALTDIAGKPYLVITSSWDLKVVDVSDPRKPTLVGTAPGDYQGGYYFGRGIAVRGATAYVTDRHQFNVVDLSDPRKPRRTGSVEVSGFTCDVQLAGNLAYVISYYDGLHVIDVSNPAKPTVVDHFAQGAYWDDAAWDNIACYQSIAIVGKHAYVTEYYSGLQVIQIAP